MSAVRLLSLLLVAALAPLHAQAQAPDSLRRVVLADGDVLIGTVEDEDADPVVVRTRNGVEQRVPRERVAAITSLLEGRFTRYDPNRSRLFFSPTARTLGRGNGRVSAYLYIFPSVAYGVSDRVDISGGSIFAFGGDGAGALLNANVKAQLVRAPGAAVAVGASAALPVGTGGGGAVAGTVYAVTTLGGEAGGVSLGVAGFYGADFESGETELANGALVLVCLERQVSNSVKLIAENYVAVGDGAGAVVLGPGVRIFGDRFGVDLYGAIAIAEGGVGGFAPFANFAYNF